MVRGEGLIISIAWDSDKGSRITGEGKGQIGNERPHRM